MYSKWLQLNTLLLAQTLSILGFVSCPVDSVLAQQADNSRISGNVFDSDGNPAAGAQIILSQRFYAGALPLRFTKTDEQGKFEFSDVKPERFPFKMVICHRSSAITYFESGPGKPGVASPLDITLQPAKSTTIVIHQPDGKPLKSGELRCRSISLPIGLPLSEDQVDGLVPVAEIVDGKASISWFDGKCNCSFVIKTDKYGEQCFHLDKKLDSLTVHLQPLCKLRGTIKDADGVGSFKGVELIVSSYAEYETADDSVQKAHSRFALAVNDDGTFETDRIGAGRLLVDYERSAQTHWYLPDQIASRTVEQPVLTPDQPVTVALTMKKAVRVTGKILEHDGTPIEKISLNVGGVRVTSDKNGCFTTYCEPGDCHANFHEVPRPWIRPALHISVPIPANVEVHELEPFRLSKGGPITGKVVDENGNAITGAQVQAYWIGHGINGNHGTQWDHCKTGTNGEFALEQTSDAETVTIMASTRDRACEKEYRVVAGDDRKIELKVVKSARLAAKGKITDEEGSPIENARVSYWLHYGNYVLRTKFDGNFDLATNNDGVFESNNEFFRCWQYHIEVAAPGFAPFKGEPITPPTEDDWDFGTIKLQRVVMAQGKVVDRAGEPIAGVKVWSFKSSIHPFRGDRDECVTDSNGNFTLNNIAKGSRFFFVEHPEYRFTGAPIPAGDTALTIRMAGIDEMPLDQPVKLRSRAAEESYGLMRDWLNHIAPQQKEKLSDFWFEICLSAVSEMDTELVNDYAEYIFADEFRARLFFKLGAINEAIALVRATDNRAHAFGILLNAVVHESMSNAQQRQILSEANSILQGELQADDRASMVGNLVIAYRKMGDHATADKLLEKYKSLAGETELGASAVLAMAKAIAPIDPNACIKLLKRSNNLDMSRLALGEVLYEAAYGGHDTVDTILQTINSRTDRIRVLAWAVKKLATNDLDRTLEMIDHYSQQNELYKAICYHQVMEVIQESHPGVAKKLLRKSFEILCRDGGDNTNHAHQLLMLAHSIDPQATGEYWWRMVASSGGPNVVNRNHSIEWNEHKLQARIALLLVTYDRYPELQKELMAALFEYWKDRELVRLDEWRWIPESFAAMTIYDPPATMRLIKELWDDNPSRFRSSPDSPWVKVVQIMCAGNDSFERTIQKNAFTKLALDPPID